MEKIIKELHGFSGNKIFLIKSHDNIFVRKIGNIKRNLDQMIAMGNQYPIPRIYTSKDNQIDMEYIHGLDMKTYLKTHHPRLLINFLSELFERFSQNSELKDYTDTYIDKLNSIYFDNDIPFTKDELIEKLPKLLPKSTYHGDLTLENIIYSNNNFVLIDCVTIEYDSYIFDIAKLRQDLECGWFTRNDRDILNIKTSIIQKDLLEKYPQANDDYLLILMLLRVYKYSKIGTKERSFLTDWINRLWK
jgi:tRNA A-37 threonylcarbamoyl transferase component Bud32